MKTKHTPGPWAYCVGTGNVVCWSQAGLPRFPFEVVVNLLQGTWNAEKRGEARANARLIALAPELLAELEHCERLLSSRFASPDTVDGRLALGEMNNIRTLLAKLEA